MAAGNISAAKGVESDVSVLTRSPAGTSVYSFFLNGYAAYIRHHLADFLRRAAWGIQLLVVVHIQNFHIHIAGKLRGSTDQAEHDVHHAGCICGQHYRNIRARISEGLLLFFAKAGGTTDQRLTVTACQLQGVHAHFHGGEIHDDIALIDDRFQIIHHRCAHILTDHRYLADVGTDVIPAGRAYTGDNLNIISLIGDLGYKFSHLALWPNNNQFHRYPPFFSFSIFLLQNLV